MAKTKRGQDTSPIVPQLSFYIDKKNTVTEYIPKDAGKFYDWYRYNLRSVQNKLNMPHYYWHYRHLQSPELMKIADLQFMIHVYSDHEGLPEDKWERHHYRNAYSLYSTEFENLIVPKLLEEKENRAIIHPYAVAYYKRWLKKPNPHIKQFYHGVSSYDRIELLLSIRDVEVESSKRYKWRKKYHNQKVKKSKDA